MNKYILKEESELPTQGRMNFMRVSETPKVRFADLIYLFNHGKKQSIMPHKVITKEVLESTQVKRAIRDLVDAELVSSSLSEAKLIKIQHKKGVAIMDRMATQLSLAKMRMLGYVVHKAFKSMYENVIVNPEEIEMVRELNERKD